MGRGLGKTQRQVLEVLRQEEKSTADYLEWEASKEGRAVAERLSEVTSELSKLSNGQKDDDRLTWTNLLTLVLTIHHPDQLTKGWPKFKRASYTSVFRAVQTLERRGLVETRKHRYPGLGGLFTDKVDTKQIRLTDAGRRLSADIKNQESTLREPKP